MASNISGVDELTKKLSELTNAKGMGLALRSASASGMRKVMNAAKSGVPVGTVEHRTYKGRLVAPGFAARSLRIHSYASPDGQKAGAILGVKSEAFYALQFIELGTSKMAARPWLRPAFQAQQQAALAQFVVMLRKRVEKAAKGGKL